MAANHVTRILGIDPGTRATGFAVISKNGRQLTLIDSGTLRLDCNTAICQRLGAIQTRIESICADHHPDCAAVEEVFTHRNARSALLLGHARGAVLAALARYGMIVQAYAPATIKQAVSGHGRADKRQIQHMVSVLLGLTRRPAQDEADAIAVAICHAMNRQGYQNKNGKGGHDCIAQWHRRE